MGNPVVEDQLATTVHQKTQNFIPSSTVQYNSERSVIPVEQSTNSSNPAISLHPIQIILTQVMPQETLQPCGSRVRVDSPGSGKISRRKNTTNVINSTDTKQILSNISSLTDRQATGQIQQNTGQPDNNNMSLFEGSKTIEVQSNKTQVKKQTRKKYSTGDKPNKQINEIPLRSQSTNQKGMVKINEKVTSNGGVFCTFRNFASSRAKTKALDKTKNSTRK